MKTQTDWLRSRARGMLGSYLTGASAIVGLLALVLPASPASALSFYGFSSSEVGRRDYERCASDLTGAKITTEAAASACASAFKPADLGKCVRQTSQQDSALTSEVVLSACREVRRPVDLSECVSEIHNRVGDAPTLAVLDNCRRSLLPKRYSDCVVGVSQVTKISSTAILDTCISASDYPSGIDPTFIRYTTNPGDTPPIAPSGDLTTPTAPSDSSTSPVTPANPAPPAPSTNPAAPASPATPAPSTTPATP